MSNEGFDKAVFDLMMKKYKHQSDKASTLKGYQRVWSEFSAFCSKRQVDPKQFNTKDIANYISHLYKEEGASSAKVDSLQHWI